MKLKYEELLEKFNDASPLEIGNRLIQQELYDEKTTLEVLKEIDEEIKGKQDVVDKLLIPLFINVADNLITKTKISKVKAIEKGSKVGLTPSRIIEECRNFKYTEAELEENKYKGIIEECFDNEHIVEGREEYNRKQFENKNELKKYREEKLKGSNGNKNKTAEDEYTGGRVYGTKADLNERNFNSKNKHMSNVDHVIPLKKKYEDLKTNFALDEKDIKQIVNSEANLAITNGNLNQSKKDSTNSEYVKKNADKLDEETKRRMVEREKQAERGMNRLQNKKVLGKFKDSDSRKNILTTAGKQSFSDATEDIENAKNAAIGTIIIDLIKVSYYEMCDIFKNGITHKTNETSKIEAFKFRLKRAFNYILKSCVNLISSIKDLLVNFAKILFDTIVNLFAGVIKNAWNVIKKGFTSIVEAIKILAKPSNEMTGAQKADALLKIAITTVTIIFGEGLDVIISKIPVLGQFSNILTPIISGLISTLLIYLLDKADIFNLEVDRKRERVKEVFSERIAEINQNIENYDKAAMEVLMNQKNQFDNIIEKFTVADDMNDIDAMIESSFEIAKNLKIDLEYNNVDEFIDFVNNNEVLEF